MTDKTSEPQIQRYEQSLNGQVVTDLATGARLPVESPRFYPHVQVTLTPDQARQIGLPVKEQPK